MLDELVEMRAWDGDTDLRVGGDVLGDLRAGDLDAVQLDVPASAQLELEDELEPREGGDLPLEVEDGLLDQALGVGGRQAASGSDPVTLEQLLADDHPLDLRRALADEQQRGVAVQPLDLVLLGVAVAAVDAEGVLDALLA